MTMFDCISGGSLVFFNIISAMRQLLLWSMWPICTDYFAFRLLILVEKAADVSLGSRNHELMSLRRDTILLVFYGVDSVAISLMICSTSFVLCGSLSLSTFKLRFPECLASSNISRAFSSLFCKYSNQHWLVPLSVLFVIGFHHLYPHP